MMPGSNISRPSVTFYTSLATRELIETLHAELGLNLGQTAVAALVYYRNLIMEGTAEKPGSSRIDRGEETRQLTVFDQPELAAWLADKAGEWGTSRGLILATAAGYYAAAIESGCIPKPLPQAKPEKPPVPKPKSNSRVQLPKPARTITLTNRAACPVCEKQVGVNPETSLLANHIAAPNVRPKGKFVLCTGSGQTPASRVIHNADTTRRLV
jgi:hypothetical protein